MERETENIERLLSDVDSFMEQMSTIQNSKDTLQCLKTIQIRLIAMIYSRLRANIELPRDKNVEEPKI